MTTKQRAYLKGLAMTMDPIFQIGKSSMTPEFTKAIAEALESKRTDQDQCSEELCRRSKRFGKYAGRAYTFSGCSGDRQKNCSL